MLEHITTDLAMEARELHGDIEGISEERFTRGDISVSRIGITTKEAAERLNKRIGEYVTLDMPDRFSATPKLYAAASHELARELTLMMGSLPREAAALVVGLGNREVTPDSLGPRTVERIFVTRHIKRALPEALPETAREVAAIAPGVMGTTGVETLEIVRGVVAHTKPSVIIAVDSLASRRACRISSTVQLSDAGISPGAGIGNERAGLDEETLGVKVIAVGVPMVVHALTIARDTIASVSESDARGSAEEVTKLLDEGELSECLRELIVTPKDIDQIVRDMAALISDGINMALFRADYERLRELIA